MNEEKLVQDLLTFTQEAVRIITESSGELIVETKSSKSDLVTNLDKLVEQRMLALIRANYPTAKIISEEFNAHAVADLSGLVFFVDPIDGTANFVEQHDYFATMMAVYDDGQPLAGVIVDIPHGDYYYGSRNTPVFKNEQELSPLPDKDLAAGLVSVGSRYVLANRFNVNELVRQSLGLRIMGSAGIEFTELLQGKHIAYLSHLTPWDLAAGRFLVEKLGLVVSKIDGTPVSMLQSENVIISTKQVHQIAIRHLHDIL